MLGDSLCSCYNPLVSGFLKTKEPLFLKINKNNQRVCNLEIKKNRRGFAERRDKELTLQGRFL
jgi:hypothetical protein